MIHYLYILITLFLIIHHVSVHVSVCLYQFHKKLLHSSSSPTTVCKSTESGIKCGHEKFDWCSIRTIGWSRLRRWWWAKLSGGLRYWCLLVWLMCLYNGTGIAELNHVLVPLGNWIWSSLLVAWPKVLVSLFQKLHKLVWTQRSVLNIAIKYVATVRYR